MRWSMKNKILKIWIDKGLIKNEVLYKEPSRLWRTAEGFAKAIAEMDCEDNEKIRFASDIKKIYE